MEDWIATDMRSNIHLNRNREALGQFTPQEVANGLRDGRFRGSDLAWREGMQSWRPLSELILELPEPEAEQRRQTEQPEVSADEMPSWEKREQLGVVMAVTQTIGEVLFSPVRSFAGMRPQAGIDNALWYLLLVGVPCGVVSNIYFYALVSTLHGLGSLLDEKMMPTLPGFLNGMLLLPIYLTLKAFFYAGIFHVMMWVMGARTRRFDATFRVVCYVTGSTAILELIPVFGYLIAVIWQSFGWLLGLREVHQTTTWRTAVAISLPFFLIAMVLLYLLWDFFAVLMLV